MQPISDELLHKAAQGDETALAALIARMMPAIRKGAWSAQAPGLDFEDAVQEGLIGLFGAVRGYDPSRGVPFAAYAANCIANAQRDAHRAATRKKARAAERQRAAAGGRSCARSGGTGHCQ